MKPPFLHLLAFAVGLAAAFGSRRAIGERWGKFGEPLPVLAGLVGAGACLIRWGLLRPEVGLALGGSALILYGYFLAGERIPFLKRLGSLVLLGCCGWVVGSGVLVESIKVPFSQRFVPLGNFAFPLTTAWLWGVGYVIASPNQAEETAVGLCSIIAAVFLAISALQVGFVGPLPSALCAGVLSCCLGVALGSRTKLAARVGPAGRAALGLMLATISVVGALKNTAFLVLVMPFLVLAFPLMEISYLLVFARRSTEQPEEEPSLPSDRSVALERRSYSLTSYLLALGMRQEQVALLAYLATAFVGAIAILLVALIKVHFAIKLLVLAIFLPAGFLIFYAAYKVLCPAGTGKETLEIFGIPIANLTSQEVSERIAEFIHSQQPHHVVTSDSLMLVRAQQDEDFRRILEKADLITPDGTGVVWAGRLLGQPIRERVSGVDLVERISQISAQRGFSVYLLGGQPGIAEEAAQVLRERHPGLNIVGIHHGYFSPEEEPEIITEIAGQRPDVLFVGLGAPRQEKWITKNLDRLQTPVCIGVGGSFDVISGHLSRAPLWMQRWGLEWLYRVLKEPKRLPRLLGLPKFMFMTARSLRGRAGERNKR